MKLNLDYRKMPILPYRQRSDLPSEPGIYYVGHPDEPVMYVGLARNLRRRHVAHHRQGQFREMQGAEIRYRVLPDPVPKRAIDLGKVLARLEKQAIQHYRPSLNGTPVPTQPKIIACGTGLLLPLSGTPVPARTEIIACGTGLLLLRIEG
ncbi:GIY-YIG nuclease family protein [Trichocoleus desertorum AS-A10]|uniref:GIY-YIG nuclease family protein n=1 Tax=Trichocoleus desertorum TaxID=1481672 RepID=UPI003296BFB5